VTEEPKGSPADWSLVLFRVVDGKLARIRMKQPDGSVVEANKVSSFLGATDDAYHTAAQELWDSFKKDAAEGKIEGVK